MGRKIIIEEGKGFTCPKCGYRWADACDLDFDEAERVPCCPECKELIEDGGDEE